ncbi:MAG: Sec-independent protein translocase protein TatB, partial [Alphaproteobacteria bacterium]|nr:Sec-independent protein translocase protein TatB [Alphaproteobacteria bacterium]
MLDFNFSEMLVVVVIALVVIGPKELPRLLYKLGQWVGKARAFVANFQNQIEEMGRESELARLREELELANQKLAHSGRDPNRTIHSATEDAPPGASAEPGSPPAPDKP